MNRLSGRTSRLPRGQSSGSLSCKHKAAHRAAAPDLPVRRRRSGDCHRQGSASSAERGIYVAASSSAAAEASTSEGPVLEEGIDLNAKAEKSGLPRVLIAGGGIGGLVAAVALLKRGYPVQVFERDLTAIRGEGKYRGPIQVQSNALAALEAIDQDLANSILEEGCVTGDRVNGLCDGITGDWYVKFDTFHPAVDMGLPVTRVISRVVLQRKLAEKAEELEGSGVLMNACHVVDYEEVVDEETGKKTVWAILADGRKFEGDVLIGADGIWSKVRTKLIGKTEPSYSKYTCYTGISDFMPPDIDTVGYRVFLGNGQYFVSSDVGGGKMQWYGFHKEAAGGKDEDGCQKQRLLEIFGDWADSVTDLIRATPEGDVLRRDIYDRPPIFKWTEGRVALLGDSAHAMQPNLGQGGCMAIEDGYQLALTLDKTVKATPEGTPVDIESALKTYQGLRVMRASSIHGLAGMAAIMASTYKAYMGEGMGGFGKWLMQFKIPHFGRVGGKLAMDLTMPGVLSWVLGGNADKLTGEDRSPHCRIPDKPKAFDEKDFKLFMHDDAALLKAAGAQWALTPVSHHGRSGTEPTTERAVMICDDDDVTIGCNDECCVILSGTDSMVIDNHAILSKHDGHHYAMTSGKTWVNDHLLPPGIRKQLRPGDVFSFGKKEANLKFKIKMYHRSECDRLERSFSADSADKEDLVAL